MVHLGIKALSLALIRSIVAQDSHIRLSGLYFMSAER
jgi:hypothetical protein